MTSTDPADILEKAADILETDGWTQGRYAEVTGPLSFSYCAVGAIRKAVTGDNWLRITTPELILTADVEYILARKLNGVHITWWNDNVAKSASEVIDVLKEAAKDIRNERKPA